MKRRLLAFCLASSMGLAALGTSSAARAQPNPEAKAAAEALFDEGRRLKGDGKFSEACPKFEESQKMAPGMGTLYNLADCYEHLGKLASAWTFYIEAAGAAQVAGQKDRADFAAFCAEHAGCDAHTRGREARKGAADAVEAALGADPAVEDVAVIGVPDERSGEAVKVLIVRKDPELDRDDIIEHCRGQLTAYKLPRYVEFRETLPKSPIGKILRRELRDQEGH